MISVYLCDDVPALRLLLRAVLEEDEAIEIVGEAGDGAIALDEVERLRPDVLVLDLSLPGFDGLELLEALRERAVDTRVVVFSGYSESQLGDAARALGARIYLEKGIDIARVREAVRDLGEAT